MGDYSDRPEVREAALRNELAAMVNSPERPAKERRIRAVCEALGEDPKLYLPKKGSDEADADVDDESTEDDGDDKDGDDKDEAKAPTKRAPAKKAA